MIFLLLTTITITIMSTSTPTPIPILIPPKLARKCLIEVYRRGGTCQRRDYHHHTFYEGQRIPYCTNMRDKALSRWPTHLASTNDMNMQMIDRLSPILSIIDYSAKPTLDKTLLMGYLLSCVEQMTKERLLILSCI